MKNPWDHNLFFFGVSQASVWAWSPVQLPPHQEHQHPLGCCQSLKDEWRKMPLISTRRLQDIPHPHNYSVKSHRESQETQGQIKNKWGKSRKGEESENQRCVIFPRRWKSLQVFTCPIAVRVLRGDEGSVMWREANTALGDKKLPVHRIKNKIIKRMTLSYLIFFVGEKDVFYRRKKKIICWVLDSDVFPLCALWFPSTWRHKDAVISWELQYVDLYIIHILTSLSLHNK